jgi:integrase/recombinase XerD
MRVGKLGFLSDRDIACILTMCDGEDRLRDRAVILLLARLGLRASEVAHLNFEQIDWAEGRVTIAGKARRAERLPLTQEVGDAIIAYIERSRPRVATSRVFLTAANTDRPA